MRKKKSKHAPEKVNHAVAVQEALQLRRSGASYGEIGKATGVNASTAWRRVRSGLQGLAKLNAKEAEHVKDIELTRLDYYIRSLDHRIRSGDEKAINAAVRISERRAKLLGIEAPKELAITDARKIAEDLDLDQDLVVQAFEGDK